MKTTPWFPGDVKPVRSGVYERMHPYNRQLFSWFESKTGEWGMAHYSKDEAGLFRGSQSALQGKPWRGLMKESA